MGRVALALAFAAGLLLGAGPARRTECRCRRSSRRQRARRASEPLPVIRRDHMKFLMHQRDDTVHGGIRGTRHSLVGCIDCHAAKDDAGQWVRIDAPGQFCASCHAYAAVKIDCFGCHAALPAVAFREAGE